MGIMTIHHVYNNGYNNPMYNVHQNVGAHYTREHMVHGENQCAAHQGLHRRSQEPGVLWAHATGDFKT